MFTLRNFALAFILLALVQATAADLTVDSPAPVVPGNSVALVISCSTAQTPIAGLQFDISFDPAILAVNLAVNSGLRSAFKSIYVANLPSGNKRILIIGLNRELISDGPLLTLFALVKADAPQGIYPIQLINPVATDPDGAPGTLNGARADIFVQGVAMSSPSIGSLDVLNGASFAAGSIAPGEVVTIIGSGIGPQQPAGLQLTAEGLVSTELTGTTITVDGQPAPMIYADSHQLSFLVPFEVTGRTAAQLIIHNGPKISVPFLAAVVPAAPALFTQDGTGVGQAAALNQDNSYNSPLQAAVAGTVVTLFATGVGSSDPAGLTGHVTSGPGTLTANIGITIGGISAEVLYAGPAPGLVAGVAQINVRIPQNAPRGLAVPIQLNVNESPTPAGVTVAIQ